MPRIRTVKPDFFDDEDVGLLSREARLLFIASWTLADDEGLLRWTAPYLKAGVFMYDDDLSVKKVAAAMSALEEAQMVFPYHGGKSQQKLGWVVNFRRHQVINRPQPGKLPPPSIQNPSVVQAYCRRDEWRCGICGEDIERDPTRRAGVLKLQPSLDHIKPRSKGGTDYPTNLRAVHQGCNASRGNRSEDDSPDDSVNESRPERKGKEGEKEGNGTSGIDIPDSPLSDLLADLIGDNTGKRPTVGKGWQDAERLLLEKDGRDPGEAERLIRWTQANEFWRANVLSMPTFREKYDQLLLNAKRSKAQGSPGMENARRLAERAKELRAQEGAQA